MKKLPKIRTRDDGVKGRRNGKPEGSALVLVGQLGSLALLSTLAFTNSLFNGFALDDVSVIVENRLIRSLHSLPTMFTTDYWAGSLGSGIGGDLYRPLVIATFAVNYAVGQLDPFGYHLVNLILHIGTCWALFVLGRALGLSSGGALASAALFAVHPIHTEAVSSVVGRAEILMSLGMLLSIICYIRSRASVQWKLRFSFASLIAFSFGLFSKEQALVLPALLALWDVGTVRVGIEKRSWKALLGRACGRYSAYLIILAAYLILRGWVLESRLFQQTATHFLLRNNPLAGLPWDVRLPTALKVAGKYLSLFVWPAQLSADYSYDAIPIATSIGEPEVLLAGLAWGALAGLGLYGYSRNLPPVFFGIGFTLLTYLPVSNFLMIIGTIMGERLFYLPSAGLCLVAGAGMDRIAAWGKQARSLLWVDKMRFGLFSLLLLMLSARTIIRNQDWHSTESLFQSALRVVPGSTKVQAANGDFLLNAGRLEGAITAYKRALTIDPNYAAVYLKLGRAYAQEARWTEAESAFRRGLEIWERDLWPEHPAIAEALNGFAELRYLQKQYAESERLLKRALIIWEKSLGTDHPAVALALSNLASCYVAQEKYSVAEPLLKRALAIREAALGPEHPLVKHTVEIYASLLRKTNRIDEAATLEARAMSVPPGRR